MANLSKSKLLAYRQCPKRLWLEIHRKELRQDSASTQASFDVGNRVGDIARSLYDPAGKGVLIDAQTEGFESAFSRSQSLLASNQPIFEAGFAAGGALAFADVMLPARKGGKQGWRMIEVKSSTSVKDYHREDIAVQAFVARTAGVPLLSVALAHIDSQWTYPGGEDYSGLLTEKDLTPEAFGRSDEVVAWIDDAQSIAAKRKEPEIHTGQHCTTPYACGFAEYCNSQEPQAQYPIGWIPQLQSKAVKTLIDEKRLIDMRELPDALLNDKQLRVKAATLSGKTYFDEASAANALAAHKLPAYFLDFETIQFAVPIWKGTRPYQMMPFQFSVHRLSRTGELNQQAFLDLTGQDPTKDFAEALIRECGERGPVFVYNAGFEKARISELAVRLPRLKQALLVINERVVDLLPVARDYYYHPDQHGSWSIKAVLPAVAPELRYDALDGVQDGGMAMNAYLEAVSSGTTAARKAEIETQLLEYCGLDTLAMVKLWKFFAGRSDLAI